MEYRRSGNTIVLRLDRGEEVFETISNVVQKEQITCGTITGLGGLDDFTTGVFDIEKREYIVEQHVGTFEIDTLTGNISTMNREPYLHMHLICTSLDGQTIGGHLFRGRVSLTLELFITAVDLELGRKHDDVLNLNKWAFAQ